MLITTPDSQLPPDYLRCLDCDETFDYSRFDSLADAGHDGHALRTFTPAEFRDAAADCADSGCADS